MYCRTYFILCLVLIYFSIGTANASHHEAFVESSFEDLLKIKLDTALAEKINGLLMAAHYELIVTDEDAKTQAILHTADSLGNINLKVLIYTSIAEKLIHYRFNPDGIEQLSKAEKWILNENCLPFVKILYYKAQAQVKDYLQKPFNEVIFCWNKGIEMAYLINDSTIIASILYYKAEYLYKNHMYDSTKTILNHVLQNFPEKLMLRNRLNAYNMVGLSDMKQGNLNESLVHFENALHFATINNDTAWMGILNGNTGQIYFLKKDFKTAFTFFKKDLFFSMADNELASAANVCVGIGKIFYDFWQQPDSAKYYFDKAIYLAAKYYQAQALSKIYENLEAFYAEKKMYEEAYYFKNRLLAYNDSIKPIEKFLKLEENENQRKLNRKDYEIRSLEKENELQKAIAQKNKIGFIMLSVVLGLLFLFTITGFKFYRLRAIDNQKIKQHNIAILQQAQALEELNTAKDKILVLLSHDLRAPIASLKNLLDLYYKNDLSESEIKKLIKTLNLEIEQVGFVMENVMRWSQFQLSESDNYTIQKIELRALVAENFSLLKNQTLNKSIALICAVEKSFVISANADFISIVLRNLLMNSIKFSLPNSSIYVSAHEENKKIWIAVKDEGIGMDEKQIFRFNTNQPLNRQNGTAGEKGVGIGLWLCKNIIQQLKGDFEVKTNYPQAGVTFTFSIPLFQIA